MEGERREEKWREGMNGRKKGGEGGGMNGREKGGS
jgi:hypothetical protein